MNKEVIEDIDRICEDSVNHPVEFDNWPFKTEEERMKENNNIAKVANFIAGAVVNDECDPMLDVLMAHQKMLEGIIRVNKSLADKIANLEGFRKNIENRKPASDRL